jgi:catechol 2,3-dioxygenase-like lactoylglutathione lyase family enzyme
MRQDGEPERRKIVDWKIEVVTIPVSDIDRARDFYADKVGFNVDIDYRISDDIRLVQLTPPGSACSIHLGKGTVDMEPGSIDGVFLVVPDVLAARADLTARATLTATAGACNRYQPVTRYRKESRHGQSNFGAHDVARRVHRRAE